MADEEARTRPIRAYLAGPGVFRRDARRHGEALKDACRVRGVEGLFPLDAEVDPGGKAPGEVALAIRRANEGLIESCDVVIADMTPFRGPGMDGGTAYEMGYARALRIPVVGYGEGPGDYAERVDGDPDDAGRDRQGMAIEGFGLSDNLMMAAGTSVCATFDEALVAGVAAVATWRGGDPKRVDLGQDRYEAGRRMREVTLDAATWEEAAEGFVGIALRFEHRARRRRRTAGDAAADA